MDILVLKQWLSALDSSSYYDVLGAETTATHGELHAAFLDFAATFHPDAHAGRSPNEQVAIGRIYRRGTEAWRILSDAALRARYDVALANGILRPEELILSLEAAAPLAGSPSLLDQVRSAGARPFVMQAEHLLKSGDPRQAKAQLVLAMHFDRKNPALEAFATQLDDILAPKRPEET